MLKDLTGDIDRYLAGQYGINQINFSKDYENRFQSWRASHQPFHWFSEFYGIIKIGGFNVIIGNPPYVDYKKISKYYNIRGYKTDKCGNLYAFVMEKSLALLRNNGRCGLIVPIASVSTESMRELQILYYPFRQWHSHFAVRPGKLFVGVDMNLTITLIQKDMAKNEVFVTGYRRWLTGSSSERPYIFNTIMYTRKPQLPGHVNPFPKIGSEIETRILSRMLRHGYKLRQYESSNGETVYYHSGGRYWRKALQSKLSSHYKPIEIKSNVAPIVLALLNSQLFYWYWISNSNCMDVVSREVFDLPVFDLPKVDNTEFKSLIKQLLHSYFSSTTERHRQGDRINVVEVNFDVQKSKSIIDKIDTLLAQHYGFTEEEMDFILNYDIKYRLGVEAEG